MWHCICGGACEVSAVGLLQAAPQRFGVDAKIGGTKTRDEITRVNSVKVNLAAKSALVLYDIGNDKVVKNMVILHYKARLDMFFCYLHQSVRNPPFGEEFDLNGTPVEMELHGNKVSTKRFLLATLQTLAEKGLESISLTIKDVSRSTISLLIAVFRKKPGARLEAIYNIL